MKHASWYTGKMQFDNSNHGSCHRRFTMRLVALGVWLLSASPATAAPLAAYLDPATAVRLVGAESINRSSTGKEAALALAPVHPAVREFREQLALEKPDIIVEAIFLWKKPGAAVPAAETLIAYNVLRSISTLQGIEYYSASRKKNRLLYEYSSLIAGPDDQTPVRDKKLDRIPSTRETLFARQNDLTFGDNRYRIVLSGGSDFVTQHSTNLTKLSMGIIPVAGPEDVHVRLLIVPVDEGLLFYVASSARAMLIPGIRNKLETSFSNRAAAVYAWFSSALTATWPQ